MIQIMNHKLWWILPNVDIEFRNECLVSEVGPDSLDHLQIRWLRNDIIEIGNAASNPLIFHHLKWNSS